MTPAQQALMSIKEKNATPCRGYFLHARHSKVLIEALELKISIDANTATR